MHIGNAKNHGVPSSWWFVGGKNQMHWVGLRNGWMGGFRMGGWVEGYKCLQRRRRGTVKRGIVAEAACATRRPTASGRTSRKKTASRKPDFSAAGRSRQRTRSTTTRKGGPNTQCRRVDVDSRVVVWRLILWPKARLAQSCCCCTKRP